MFFFQLFCSMGPPRTPPHHSRLDPLWTFWCAWVSCLCTLFLSGAKVYIRWRRCWQTVNWYEWIPWISQVFVYCCTIMYIYSLLDICWKLKGKEGNRPRDPYGTYCLSSFLDNFWKPKEIDLEIHTWLIVYIHRRLIVHIRSQISSKSLRTWTRRPIEDLLSIFLLRCLL